MFKNVKPEVWAFDAEWVPDPLAGRLLYGLSDTLPDRHVMEHMWMENGATPENPQPYLKTIMCRVISISAVCRTRNKDGQPSLALRTRPRPGEIESAEHQVIGPFLDAVGGRKPQLVGFNSVNADIKAFIQRAVVGGLQAGAFCSRPDKPWEGVDYFARGDAHVDLHEVLSGWGRSSMNLHEVATLCGIPGKMDVSGGKVPNLWLDGRLEEIIAYNEFDALTTYLLWLRVAHFAGFLSTAQYAEEQRQVEVQILEKEAPQKPHLKKYLQEWQRLRK